MMIKKSIITVKNNMTLFIVLDMMIALFFSVYFPAPVKWLQHYALFASFLMVFPIMININFASILKATAQRKLLGVSLGFHFIASPVILFFILKLFNSDPNIAAGLLFIAIMPASGMAAVWTKMNKGTVSITIVILCLSLLLSLFTIPAETYFLIGNFVSVPIESLVNVIIMLVLAPMILGFFTRKLIIKSKGEAAFTNAKPYISFISSLGLLLIIFIAFGLKGGVLFSQPSLVLNITLPMLVYYAIGFIFLNCLAKRMGFTPADTIALCYGTMTKNRSMATAIAIAIFDPLSVTAIALAGVVAQIPMMLLYSKMTSVRLCPYVIKNK